MEQYCHSIEEKFMEEMFPRPTEPYLQPQKSSAWLEKAKQITVGEKKVEVFNFKPEVRLGLVCKDNGTDRSPVLRQTQQY